MTGDEILEDARANLDRRLPRAGEFRTDETLTATAPEPARNAVGRLRRPMLNDLPDLVRPRFDGDVAIGTSAKARPETDRQSGEPAQIGSGEIFLHPGIHQDVEAAKNDEIEQPELGDNDAGDLAKAGPKLKAPVGALPRNAPDPAAIIEQPIIK